MKRALLIFIIIVSNACAWNPPIKDEAKLKYATWAGRGVISEKTFIQETDDGYLWKATLSVEETLKGTPSEKLEFYFKQSTGPSRGGSYVVRCPPFPKVEKGDSVRIFLHAHPSDEDPRLFLNGDQMINKEPNPESCVVAKPTTRLLLNKPD